jgi:leucyl aminopeptidase
VLEACALAARRARALRAGTLAIGLPESLLDAAHARAAAEGVVLGHHEFTAYRTQGASPPLRTASIVTDRASSRALHHSVRAGVAWGEATCIARDLAATPGQDLVPEQLAERAKDIAEGTGSRARTLRVPQLERLGMGALLAVGRGSVNPPCLVVLERSPSNPVASAHRKGRGTLRASRGDGPRGAAVGTIVLVGKGITFDTGGISIKPREDMHRMKYDMSGAAAVIGTFSALSTLDLPFRIVGLLACAENMPGGRALKPGDVLRTMGGATVEVTNTDAEGRLVLADALGYANTLSPSAVVDLATLTGAIRIALGRHAAGLFTPDDALAAELLAAAGVSGQPLWRMPLGDAYVAELRSDTADLVNFAGREGGASIAASFLSRFAGRAPWAHLDIASTAWSNADRPHEPKGPTGFGVRLLLEWISRRASSSEPGPSSRAAPTGAASTPRRARSARRRSGN